MVKKINVKVGKKDAFLDQKNRVEKFVFADENYS